MRIKKNNFTQEQIEKIGNDLLGMWIPREKFDALLMDCDLPNKIADLYRQKMYSGWENAHNAGFTKAERADVERHIEPTVRLLKQHIAENLFYVTGLLAHQLSILTGGEAVTKTSSRFFAEVFLIQGTKSGLLLRDSRGRPPVWTRAKLEQKIRSAVKAFRKRKYRSPTIVQTAAELKMPVATLKKLLQRHGLLYSTYKKET
jgi:hypothetical protein